MNTGLQRIFRIVAGVLVATSMAATAVQAQRVWGGFYGRTPPKFATAASFDGSFNFCPVPAGTYYFWKVGVTLG